MATTKPENTQKKPTVTPEPILVQGSPVPYSSKAVIILVLSIINLIVFPIIPGIIALTMVKNTLVEIDKSKGFLRGKELVKIGQLISIVGLALQTIGLFIGLIFLVVGIIIGTAALLAIA